MKKFSLKRKVLVGFAAGVFAVALMVPAGIAIAATTDYPGTDYTGGTITEANNIDTTVGLKTATDQLKFTGPTTINFAVKSDGAFSVPTDAKFTNNSIFDLKIASYAISDVATGATNAATAEAYTSSTADNTYYIDVTGTPAGGSVTSAIPFSASQTSVSGFTIPYDSAGSSNTLALAFTGKMKNITASTWTSGKTLQKVNWVVAPA